MTAPVKKKLTIPALPKTIYVVELDEYIIVTGFPITECVFPIYRFDNGDAAYDNAFQVADDIAIKTGKLVANAVDFNLDDPLIYDPIKINEQMKNLIKVIAEEKAKIIPNKK